MKKYFTKEELRTVLDLWDTNTKEEIAEKIGRNVASIGYIAMMIRKAGYNLPRKSVKHQRGKFIKEFLEEEGLI